MREKGLATSCFGCLNSFWGDWQKGLATSYFDGLVTALGANERESYNPAIISGQTGCDRSIRPLLSLVENFGGKGPRNTHRLKAGAYHSLLISCLEETSRSKALDLVLLAKEGDCLYVSEDFPSV